MTPLEHIADIEKVLKQLDGYLSRVESYFRNPKKYSRLIWACYDFTLFMNRDFHKPRWKVVTNRNGLKMFCCSLGWLGFNVRLA